MSQSNPMIAKVGDGSIAGVRYPKSGASLMTESMLLQETSIPGNSGAGSSGNLQGLAKLAAQQGPGTTRINQNVTDTSSPSASNLTPIATPPGVNRLNRSSSSGNVLSTVNNIDSEGNSTLNQITPRTLNDNIIPNISFFSMFPEEVVPSLIQLGKQQSLKQGNYLYRRGDARDKFYVILDGLIRLSTEAGASSSTTEARHTTVGTFTRGDVLCETSFYINNIGGSSEDRIGSGGEGVDRAGTDILSDIRNLGSKTSFSFRESGDSAVLGSQNFSLMENRDIQLDVSKNLITNSKEVGYGVKVDTSTDNNTNLNRSTMNLMSTSRATGTNALSPQSQYQSSDLTGAGASRFQSQTQSQNSPNKKRSGYANGHQSSTVFTINPSPQAISASRKSLVQQSYLSNVDTHMKFRSISNQRETLSISNQNCQNQTPSQNQIFEESDLVLEGLEGLNSPDENNEEAAAVVQQNRNDQDTNSNSISHSPASEDYNANSNNFRHVQVQSQPLTKLLPGPDTQTSTASLNMISESESKSSTVLTSGPGPIQNDTTVGDTNGNYNLVASKTQSAGAALISNRNRHSSLSIHSTEALAVNDTIYLVFNVRDVLQWSNENDCEVHLQVAAGSIARERISQRAAVTDVNFRGFRTETDSMGSIQIPRGCYYGIQTQRALNVMSASGVPLSHYPALVRALVVVKKVCAQANLQLGHLEPEIGSSIIRACDEILEGNLHDEFLVDMLQGGGGISTMANANEVIANRATQLLGGGLGEYLVNPNQHVNMSQSDDAYHTVMRLSLMYSFPGLSKRMADSIQTLYRKSEEFKDVIKMGRTMLQDAVPTRLGREFLAWARILEDDWMALQDCQKGLNECLLGGTMLGTGLGNSHKDFSQTACQYLSQATGIEFQTPQDLMKGMIDITSLLQLSSTLRRVAVRTSKICNDLRLMSSGPRCGLKEINLPEMQPGSSIMPGKVNPVIPEAMSQVCFNVIGNDVTVTMASEGSQLNACIFDTVIVYSILESMQMLSRGFSMLNRHCLVGITCNRERCRKMVEESLSKLTAALPILGYERCSEVAEEALNRNVSIEQILKERKLLSYAQINQEVFTDEKILNEHKVVAVVGQNQCGQVAAEDPWQPNGNRSFLQAVWKSRHLEPVLMDEGQIGSGLNDQKFNIASRLKTIEDKFRGPKANQFLSDEDLTKIQVLATNDVFGVLTLGGSDTSNQGQNIRDDAAIASMKFNNNIFANASNGSLKSLSNNSLANSQDLSASGGLNLQLSPQTTNSNPPGPSSPPEDDFTSYLAIKDMMHIIHLDAGQPLYKAGDENKYVYCLQQGVIKLVNEAHGGSKTQSATAVTTSNIRAPHNRDQDIWVFSDGASIAEASLLTKGFFDHTMERAQGNKRRNLTAIAEVTSVVWKIELDALKPFISHPSRKKLALSLARRISEVLYRRLKDSASGAILTRIDNDLLGNRRVPINVYWGVQTLRARENFRLTGILTESFPNLQKAFAYVKKACAIANRDQGTISEDVGRAIINACDEIISGKLNAEFVTDMIQGGAGTSTNMNVNEVLANRANEILGDRKGTYKFVHPNDHVNKSQSTNDAYPTSLHLAIVLSAPELMDAMDLLSQVLREKGREFDQVLKMGRTQLQDAVPVTLGQEFYAFARGIEAEMSVLKHVTKEQQTTNLGGTAVGTGIAADRDFARLVTKSLSDVTGFQFTKPEDLIEASSNTAGMLRFMSCLKGIGIKVSKLCNDLRFMSSGPRCGIGEIAVPAVQPHTSLIPGKSDPDLCEMVSMCTFRVMGSDIVCSMASHAGQMELNYAEPVMIYHILSSIRVLSSAFNSLALYCIKDIKANKEHCQNLVNNSVGVVTCLLPYIGYKACAKAAKTAIKENRAITEVLVTENYMTSSRLKEILVPERLVQPGRLAKNQYVETDAVSLSPGKSGVESKEMSSPGVVKKE